MFVFHFFVFHRDKSLIVFHSFVFHLSEKLFASQNRYSLVLFSLEEKLLKIKLKSLNQSYKAHRILKKNNSTPF